MNVRFVRFFFVSVFMLVAMLAPQRVFATERYGPLQVSGSLETQNLLRHPDIDQWSFIQQRNTLRLRFDLDIIKDNVGTLGFAFPGIRSANAYLLYRPVYDSVFDIQPGGRADLFPYGRGEKDNSLHAFTSSVRDSIRETNGGLNAFREAYLDVALSEIPVSFRLGRQQVVWGESDNFRLLDRVNPLDFSWHFQQESWDNIRIPLWMVKGLYRFGDIGPFSEGFFEGFWDLGDWVPAKKNFLPYPWGVPIDNPFTDEATCTDPNNSFTCKDYKFLKGVPFRRGGYDKNPIDNGQWGARIVFNTPQGVQMGLHYFYTRFPGDDGSQPTFLRAVDQTQPFGPGATSTNNLVSIGNGVLPAEVIYPYVHTVGLSANYAEDEYTQTVYRLETIYQLDLPFSDLRKAQKITNPSCLGSPSPVPCALAPELPDGLFGTTKADMWNGMVGFDRPTWIRLINGRSTVLITGQFFWHRIIQDSSHFLGSLSAADKVREWEILTTLSASTFMGPGGKDVPLVFVALDPVNHYNLEVGWKNDYFVTNNFIVTLFQNYFVVPNFGGEVDETWGIGGLFKKRDETGVRVTYQF